MTEEKAWEYIGRIQKSIKRNSPVKAIALILYITKKIRETEGVENEGDLITSLFFQEDTG